MILVIGQKNLKAVLKNKSAFTLIELILTALIMLIIVGLSVPVFRASYSDLRINLQAKDMAGLMKLAREKAVMTRVRHIIEIDENGRTYRMMSADEKKDKKIPIEGRWGKRFHISSNIKIETDENVINFFPDGSSDKANILFEDNSGLKSRINVNPKTGEIIVGK